jgi:hypothetical protein
MASRANPEREFWRQIVAAQDERERPRNHRVVLLADCAATSRAAAVTNPTP